MLAALADTVDGATAAVEAYDYARALEIAERSFWNWTDDYVELVKSRAYDQGPGAPSAHAALQLALSVYLRLFAPFLPFVTEEVWSWWKEGSVHRSSWPSRTEFEGSTGDPEILEMASSVLGEIRRAKSDAKASMRAEVESVVVTADPAAIERAREAEGDLLAAGRAASVEYAEGDFSVVATLAQDSSS
jgi:valyl-tRNA synthetase